jgi:hypothetical protein
VNRDKANIAGTKAKTESLFELAVYLLNNLDVSLYMIIADVLDNRVVAQMDVRKPGEAIPLFETPYTLVTDSFEKCSSSDSTCRKKVRRHPLNETQFDYVPLSWKVNASTLFVGVEPMEFSSNGQRISDLLFL